MVRESGRWLLALHLCLVVLFGTSIFLASPGYFSPDSARYMSWAINIARGQGYTTYHGEPVLDRGPVFAGSIAAVLAILGESVDNAYIVPRLVWILNLLIVYLIGRRLYSPLTGLLAASLVASVLHLFDLHNRVLLDGMLATCMCISLLLALLGFQRGKWGYFVLSGVAPSLAYLVKPTATTWAPLPLLILLLVRKHRSFKGAAQHYQLAQIPSFSRPALAQQG